MEVLMPFASPLDVIEGRARWSVTQATDSLSVLRDLPTASCHALITDPPYSSGGLFASERSKSTTEKYVQSDTKNKGVTFFGDNRDQRSFAFWSVLWLGEALRVCVDGAAGLVFTDWRQLPITTDVYQGAGWTWRGVLVWDKTEGTRPVLGRPRAQCEYVVWGSNGKMPVGGEAYPGCIRTPIESKRWHQTAKPVSLMETLVKLCPPDGVVLDPFCGSGSTGVAALRAGRRFIGLEHVEHYVGVARERVAAQHALAFPQERSNAISSAQLTWQPE